MPKQHHHHNKKHPKKTKHAVTAATTTTVELSVKESDPLVDPLVVSFPSGLPSAAVFPKFAWKPLHDKKPKNGRIVVGSDRNCIYQAQNLGRGHDGRRTKLLVGVLDKQRNQLTLHSAAQRGTVYALQQSVPAYSPHYESSQQSAIDRHRALFESFGSAKKRAALKSQQKNVVNVESVVGAAQVNIKQALQKQRGLSESNRLALQQEQQEEGEKSASALEVAFQEARRAFLPKFDADAKEPRMVYDARDMAGEDAWEAMGRITGACLHKAKEGENWISFVTARGGKKWLECTTQLLQSIAPQSPHAKYQVKCAMLMNHMIHFYHRAVAAQGRSKHLRGSAEEIAENFYLPNVMVYRFLDVFCTSLVDNGGRGGGYAVSKQDKDRCRLQILLLYLLAGNMKVGNILPVVQELKMEPTEASKLLHAAGCTVTKRGPNAWSVALTVPLTFPPPPKRGGKPR